MRKVLVYLLCIIFLGCKQNLPQTMYMKKCVINDITYNGFHSTIEPDPIWEIKTDCGLSLKTKNKDRYKIGDTITYYIKTVENEKIN